MTPSNDLLDTEIPASDARPNGEPISSPTVRAFTIADLELWRSRGLINRDQLANILAFHDVASSSPAQPASRERVAGLNLVNIAYYFGGFLFLLAFTFLLGTQWFDAGESRRIGVALIAITVPMSMGIVLLRMEFQTPGNLLIFAATGISPLLVYTVQQRAGLWPGDGNPNHYQSFYEDVLPSWVFMEVIAIAVSMIAVVWTRFPLMTLLTAFWTWFLSMDLVRWMSGSDSRSWNSDLELTTAALFGIVMIATGLFLQMKIERDYSLWLYLFGHITFIGAFSALALEHQAILGWLVFPLVYVGIVFLSVWLQRKIFLVFGAIGAYGWATYLVFDTFNGALGISFGFALVGLLIVLSGVGYRRAIEPMAARVGSASTI